MVVVTIIGLLSVAGAMAADEQTISGTIEKGDQGIVLTADDGQTYMVEGKDLSAMVGKNRQSHRDAGGKRIRQDHFGDHGRRNKRVGPSLPYQSSNGFRCLPQA